MQRGKISIVGIGLVGLSIGMGCDKRDTKQFQQREPNTSHTDTSLADAKLPPLQRVDSNHYDLPISCPIDQEFIPISSKPRALSETSRQLINSAFYLWREATKEASFERATVSLKIPVLPGSEQLEPGDPLQGAIKSALEPLELSAAYVNGIVVTTDQNTNQQRNYHFQAFTFRNTETTDFFALLGSIGHESQHAIQALKDDPRDPRKSLQERFRRELDAYAREVQDLLLVNTYLEKSDNIPQNLRDQNLVKWKTALAGQINSAGYYSFRFKTQYLAAVIDASLDKISGYLVKQGVENHSSKLADFRKRLGPLLEYKKNLEIEHSIYGPLIDEINQYVSSIPEINDRAPENINAKTKSLTETLSQFDQSIIELGVAKARLVDWQAEPKPLD